jgi:MarR family transcriptional regulator, 2-MHQ and catechol-resistance regulon repressor
MTTVGTANHSSAGHAGHAGHTGHADETAAFHRALSELVRVYQFRDRDRICCHDVSVTQCYALEALVRSGGQTLNELAAELYLAKSTASRVADGLERKGYLVRAPHPTSRRSILLQATAAGAALHARIEQDILAEEADLLADFDPEVRRGMTRLLESLAAAASSRVERGSGTCCSIEPVTLIHGAGK